MRLIRPLLGDPRFQMVGLLILAILFFAGIFSQNKPEFCPSCPGHRELAGNCLCYHAPPSTESSRR